MEQKRYVEAKQLFEECLAVESKWPNSNYFRTRRYLARCSIELGIYDRAIELLVQTMQNYSLARKWNLIDDVEAHYYLGRAYEGSSWQSKAIVSYENFLYIWKNADEGLKSVEDAKERLAKLKET